MREESERGACVVMTTHSFEEAERLADRALAEADGVQRRGEDHLPARSERFVLIVFDVISSFPSLVLALAAV